MTDRQRMPYLGRYLVALVLVTIGAKVLQAIAFQFGVLLPEGGLAIVPPLIAALHCGQVWGREQGALPENRVAWRWAFVTMLLFLALQLVLWPLALAAVNVSPEVLRLVALITGGTTIMALLLNRFFLTVGAKAGIARPRG